MTSLTALTSGTERKVVATPEALIEFENFKVVLNSPPVLQQFRYDRTTIVYNNASIGCRSPSDGMGEIEVPVGLLVVIVDTDDDGCDYVCAYASAGLTTAQRNYHIVRLELLAFVFACGKFYDWLAGSRLYVVPTAVRMNSCIWQRHPRTLQLHAMLLPCQNSTSGLSGSRD